MDSLELVLEVKLASRRNNMGRLIGTSTQYLFLPTVTFTNAYGYDAASNRTSFTAPDGTTNTYQYDTLNRLSTLTSSLTGQFTFGYDALNRRTSLSRPNGVSTSYSYDSLSRLLSVLHQTGGSTVDGETYTYDPAGNRTGKANQLNSVTEQYTGACPRGKHRAPKERHLSASPGECQFGKPRFYDHGELHLRRSGQ